MKTSAEQKRTKAALACRKALDSAADSLRVLLEACEACNDGSGSVSRAGNGNDGREIMIADLREYAAYLERQYPTTGGAA